MKRAQGGEDFAKLAKEFSQDPGSAQQGGDLGWSERKVWVAPFADAAFSMKEGEIRGPVKTQFGYHILKLDGIQPATVKTFEQSKSDLEAEYRRNEAERLFNNAQDQLADAALQNTTDIDVVARKAGLTVHDIPNFSRTDGGGDLGKVAGGDRGGLQPGCARWALEPDRRGGERPRRGAARNGSQAAAAKAAGGGTRRDRGRLEEAARRGARRSSGRGRGQAADGGRVVGRRREVPGRHRRSRRSSWRAPTRRCRSRSAAHAFDEPKPAGKPIYSSVALGNGDAAVLALSAVREDPSGDPKAARRADCAANLRNRQPRPRRRAMPPRRAPMPR